MLRTPPGPAGTRAPRRPRTLQFPHSLNKLLVAHDCVPIEHAASIVRDIFLSTDLTVVAAIAPLSANDQYVRREPENPKKENTIQIGGANAGITLSKNTAKKRIKREPKLRPFRFPQSILAQSRAKMTGVTTGRDPGHTLISVSAVQAN